MIEGIIEASGSIVRYFFIDVIIEILCRSLGVLITKSCSKYIDPKGYMVVLIGVVGWCLIIFAAVLLFT